MIKKPNYLTVPAAICELEKIEMTRQLDKVYRLDHAVTKTQQVITKKREQYDRLTAELEELHNKQKAIQSEELMKAIAESSRSYEEILEFIQGDGEIRGGYYGKQSDICEMVKKVSEFLIRKRISVSFLS